MERTNGLYRVTFHYENKFIRILVVRATDATEAYHKAIELLDRSGNRTRVVEEFSVEDLNTGTFLE